MKPINVFYDHQIFSLQKYGGISRYFCSLIKEFHQGNDVKIITGGIISDNQYLKKIPEIKRYTLPLEIKRGRIRLSNLINSLEEVIRFKRFDLYHPTYYNSISFKRSIPHVITVYDMIHEKFPQYFSKSDKTSERKRRLCETASKIIAISNNTKNDLIDIFSVPADKIEVVYLNAELDGKIKEIEGILGKKFILFVGSRQGYKNFDLFIEAVSRVFQKDKSVFLLICGGGSLNNLEKEKLSRLGVDSRVIQKDVTDAELAWAYQNALFFIFPSLYEGFGIPILEAFNFGCPVVLSRSSSFPEIAGEAGFYFNPFLIDSIEESVLRVINDQKLRENLRDVGFEQVKKFSSKETAMKTFEVYKKALG